MTAAIYPKWGCLRRARLRIPETLLAGDLQMSNHGLNAIQGVVAALLAATAVPAAAIEVAWTDWVSGTATLASGTITSGATTLGVTIASPSGFFFVQTGAGTNFWTEGNPKPYTGGAVTNAPPAAEMVALGNGGLKTITFDRAVTDPYIAFVSWNGNAAQFSGPFVKVSEGCGFYGCGTFTLGANNSFVGTGEATGVLKFTGTFSTLSFTDSTEAYHGLTIGIAGVAPAGGVPEPGVWAMLVGGFGLVGAAARRRRVTVTA